jgi:hypothetical protein
VHHIELLLQPGVALCDGIPPCQVVLQLAVQQVLQNLLLRCELFRPPCVLETIMIL